MKHEDIIISENKDQRLIEVLTLENGINYSRDIYQYHYGKLNTLYTYRWSESGEWEKTTKSIFKCWGNNFLVTEYSGSDSSWTPECEIWVKFDNGKAVEITQYGYISAINQMRAIDKWKYSYEGDRLVMSELKVYEDLNWLEFIKIENSYIGDILSETKSYRYQDAKWILSGYSEFHNTQNTAQEIISFISQNNNWLLSEKHNFQYSNSLLSVWESYHADHISDALRMDCSTQYTYDENGVLILECIRNSYDIIEKFYIYEDSCGNYDCTLGSVCSALRFPLELPHPI